jgi:putative membrane protein
MHRPVRSRTIALVLPLAVLLACGGGRAPASTTAAPGGAATPVAPLPDANTGAILLASHSAAIAAANVANSRGQHRDVKALARTIVTDHAAMNTRLTRLIEDIGLATRDDDISRLLREQSAARRDTLRRLPVRQFDSAYVANEVRYHRDLLVAIDEVFLPSAVNVRLRDYVTSMRPTIASHLELARQLQTTLAARR